MYPRTLGLGSFLALLVLPAVVLAEQKSANDERIDRLPALIAPIIAQVESSGGATKASPTAAKDTKDQVSRQEFNTAISRIEDRLETIAQSLSKNNPGQPAKNQPTPADPPPAGETKPDAQAKTDAQAKPAAGQAGPTQAEFNALRDRVYDQEVILANVAKKISQPGGAERYIVDIRGNLQDSTFRKDLADAVDQVLPRQGTLHVRNAMGTTQTIAVNGQEYQVPAGDQLVVNVPVGTVTTELVGFEAPRNWSIGPPTNDERIVIGAAPERRVAGYAPSVYAPAAEAPVYAPAAAPAPTVTIVTPTCGCAAY